MQFSERCSQRIGWNPWIHHWVKSCLLFLAEIFFAVDRKNVIFGSTTYVYVLWHDVYTSTRLQRANNLVSSWHISLTTILTSGIHGGYRLVCTYDIPDPRRGGGRVVFWDTRIWTLWQFSLGGGYSGTFGFGLSDNFHWRGILGHSDLDSLTIFMGGGGILGHLDLDSLTIFILGGGYSGTLRFGLSDNFHWGGVFWDTRIWTLWQFSFWGGILGHSDLDSLTIFILGGYSGTLGFGLSDNFHFGGVFWDTRIWTLWQFSFWGGILGHSELDSLTIFILGGYSGTLGFGLSDNFHLGGGRVFWDTRIWTLWQFSFG